MTEDRKRKEIYTVTHESKRYQISLEGRNGCSILLQDLVEEVANQCGVPPKKQKLIFKGKTLNDFSCTLNELGITPQSKIMVIGKKFDLAEQQKIMAIEKIVNLAGDLWKKFEEIKTEKADLERGYLDPLQSKDSFDKLIKRIRYLGEGLMKHIESLDAMILDASFLDAKERKKKAVTIVNKYLTEVDHEEEALKELGAKL